MNIQAKIENFILEDLLAGSRQAIPSDEPLFATGTLDSLGTLRLIAFLEETFGLTINDGDVVDTNFGTIEKLTHFVDSRKRAEF